MKNIDESYLYLAATRIEPLLHALVKEMGGARTAEDVECVHQARVASRRLRSALKMFGGCFPPKKFKRWRNSVQEITRQLGEARDLDVQILFLDRRVRELGTEEKKLLRPGLSRLMLRQQQRRDAIQKKVVGAIDDFERAGVLEEVHGDVSATIFALERKQIEYGSHFVYTQAAKHIRERLADLMSFETAMAKPDAAKEHHKMRIAAKRLRYTLELCDPAFDGALDPYIKSVKKLQTLLGDLHDCDVWDAMLDEFVEEERERTRVYFGHSRPFSLLLPGIEFLRADRRATRQRLFDEVSEYWASLDAKDHWTALQDLVQDRVDATTPEDAASTYAEETAEVSPETQAGQEDEQNDCGFDGGRAWESAGPREGTG